MKSLFSYRLIIVCLLLESEFQANCVITAPLCCKTVGVVKINFGIAFFFLLERNADCGTEGGTGVQRQQPRHLVECSEKELKRAEL